MYKVFYNGCKAKQFANKTFPSYDAARNAVRKYIRARYGALDYANANPAISDFGFSVKAA